jgi:hypothetical protein
MFKRFGARLVANQQMSDRAQQPVQNRADESVTTQQGATQLAASVEPATVALSAQESNPHYEFFRH